MRRLHTLGVLLLFVAASGADAQHVHLRIDRREPVLGGRPFGAAGAYEKLVGKVEFTLDPKVAANEIVVDLPLAPRNAAGQVEYSADFYMLKPVDPAKGNGGLFYEVGNRGTKAMLSTFQKASGSQDPTTEAQFGDGTLMDQGFALLWMGWQWDVPDGRMRMEMPIATDGGQPITGLVRGNFIPNERAGAQPLADRDHKTYPVLDSLSPENVMTVRANRTDTPQVVPHGTWRFVNGTSVVLDGGFEPGMIYDVVYRTKDPRVMGVGLAGTRDLVSFFKNEKGADNPMSTIRYALTWGSSQTGRFLRHFLYEGFNRDAQGRRVFDGVLDEKGGAGRGSFNQRFGQASRDALEHYNILYPVDMFPFADGSQTDPVTGKTDGLLARAERDGVAPKIFHILTNSEYYNRAGSLLHTDVNGVRDIPPPANSRIYLVSGAPHIIAQSPPVSHTSGTLVGLAAMNPLDYRPVVRALFQAMNRWVTEDVAPPPSRYPQFADGTLVPRERAGWPAIPGFTFPPPQQINYRLDFGPRWAQGIVDNEPPKIGKPFVVRVPAVDADGNDRAGVREPELAVPLATHTGWNYRDPSIGAPEHLAGEIGSYIPFARTRAEREKTGDPRLSIEERYENKDVYLAKISAAADGLVRQGYLLAKDVPDLVKHASAHWDWATAKHTAPVKSDLLTGLTWRNVGPFRGGRIAAVTGAMGEPGVYYVGLPAGGVWKTTSAGETWYPVFDAVKDVSSIGSVEVAPSNPNVIYVGTGDKVTGGTNNVGTGMYKSDDAGATWRHIGLDDARVIPSLLVDPANPDIVLAAAEGNVNTKSEMRGVYRSTDGGRSWTRTLFLNDSTGVQKLARAYDRPDVIYATTIRHYNAPVPPSGITPAPPAPSAATTIAAVAPTTRLYKSTDGGLTWTEISGGGLPRLNGCEYVAVAMHTNAQRAFVIGNNGLFRTDDGGTTWRQMDPSDERIRNGQGGYNCGVYVDTKNPDVVYTIHTSSYKSTDGGNTFTGFKGAPGGDDPQQLWLDPMNSDRMLLGLDQGAVVTLDGGKSWGSWYNQSTEQVYHVSTDNSFPYWIYATQQDAGSIRIRSRGNFGEITPLDWGAVPAWEWGTIIPDPLNTNTVYASGNPTGLEKISYPSEQWISVSPASNPDLHLRTAFSQPIEFAPWNPHDLLAGFQFLMATTDAGEHWKKLSPDLTYPKGMSPSPDTAVRPPGSYPAGGIETISASTIGRGTIWAGTSNGLIKVTRDDGKSWDDVTIPGLPFAARALVSIIDASHTDPGGAYAAVDISRGGDNAPYFYRTHDYGKTWTRITNGLPTGEPSGSYARVIRADPKRAGLLVAGTESAMYISFDDGDSWQSLQLNLPNTSYRDIAFAGNDLIVGTYGRGIWVLDDYAVLRQMTPALANESMHLFKPDATVRVRRNTNFDTPFPPEVPHALNPPDGVIITYSLESRPAGAVAIDILDSAGTTIRHMSSIAAPPVAEAARPPNPNFWLAPPRSLPVAIGSNRTNWDLRYDSPPAFAHTFEINANPGLTPPTPEGIFAPPGTYTIKLTVDGKSATQKAVVTNDPRSPATLADIHAQAALLVKLNTAAKIAWDGALAADTLRVALNSRAPADSNSEAAIAVRKFRVQLDSVAGPLGGRRPPPNFHTLNAALIGQLTAQDNGDLAPTEAMLDGYASTCRELRTAAARWATLISANLNQLNAKLSSTGAQPIVAPPAVHAPECPAKLPR